MKFGVITFPGSNCDDDMVHVLGTVMGFQVERIWHKETALSGFRPEDCIVIPGGFSYGDYLRAGAIARFSPVMQAVIDFAGRGGIVWGICNGFQILCEAHLLPGVLIRNTNQKFIGKNCFLKVASSDSPLSEAMNEGQVLEIPIAHAEGRYHADEETIESLISNRQVLFQYCDNLGNVTKNSNPNGSVHNIAGICNQRRNVIGMMPHPERAAENVLGMTDGLFFFHSLRGYKSEVSL